MTTPKISRRAEKHNTQCALIVFAISIIEGLLEGLYSGFNKEVPLLAAVALGFAFIWATYIWVKADAAKRQIRLPFDFGTFMYVFWPIIGTWYMYKSRGITGIYWIAIIVISFLASRWIGNILIWMVI